MTVRAMNHHNKDDKGSGANTRHLWMLGCIGLAVGMTWNGNWAQLSSPSWVALAQSANDTPINDAQVTLFAKVVLAIEPIRIEAQKKATEATDENVKDQIRRDFIRKATEIITSNGMTVGDYNRITLKIRSPEGQAVKTRIEREIITLQQPSLPVSSPTP